MSEVQLVEVKTTVSKEMHELICAPVEITGAILKQAADGLTVDEIVSSLAMNVSKILAAADGLKMLDDEVKEETAAFVRACVIPTTDILTYVKSYKKAKDAMKETASNEGAGPDGAEAAGTEPAEDPAPPADPVPEPAAEPIPEAPPATDG